MEDLYWKMVSIIRSESTIVSEGFKGGTRGAPIMPRDAVSRTANVERTGGKKLTNIVVIDSYKEFILINLIIKDF